MTDDTITVTGTADFRGPVTMREGLQRTYLREEPEVAFSIPLRDFYVWDSGVTLPTAATADDLGYVTQTYGTGNNVINSGDCKAATTTRYARVTVRLPECYVAGETVKLVASAGMKTTVSDTTCTIDFQAYKVGRDGLVSGSDLVATSATTINSLTFAEKEFTVTATTLAPGDELDIRVTIACVDGATATAVTPTIGAVDLWCDCKG